MISCWRFTKRFKTIICELFIILILNASFVEYCTPPVKGAKQIMEQKIGLLFLSAFIGFERMNVLGGDCSIIESSRTNQFTLGVSTYPPRYDHTKFVSQVELIKTTIIIKPPTSLFKRCEIFSWCILNRIRVLSMNLVDLTHGKNNNNMLPTYSHGL